MRASAERWTETAFWPLERYLPFRYVHLAVPVADALVDVMDEIIDVLITDVFERDDLQVGEGGDI